MAMHTGVLGLESLVKDNLSQTRHVQELDAKVQDLSLALDELKSSKAIPEREIKECLWVISVLQEEQRDIESQRADELQNSRDRSILSGAGFIGFSLLVIIVLFAFLLLDAMRRQTFEW